MKKIIFILCVFFTVMYPASHYIGSWDEDYKKLARSLKKRKRRFYCTRKKKALSPEFIEHIIESYKESLEEDPFDF